MLISEAELRAALEPILDRVLAERLRLFQLQLEPRIQALIAAGLEPEAAQRAQRGLRAVLGAASPSACFDALFEHAAANEARALLVAWDGEIAVWRQQGTGLPERFPALSQDLVLRGGTFHSLKIRGRVIGGLYWKGAAGDAAQLEMLARAAELALLELALPAAPAVGKTVAVAETSPARAARPAGPTAAHKFAALLLEDLALYLEHERRTASQEEIARCRRAYQERFPGEPMTIFEEELPRLAG